MSGPVVTEPGEILMPFDPDECPFTAAWRVIGGKWKGVLWWRLSLGIGRFLQLQRSVPHISRKMLAQQLRELERDGIVQRREVTGRVPTVEYSLTQYGRSLEPVIAAICSWGQAHLGRTAASALAPPARARPLGGDRRGGSGGSRRR
jgi:DNA-binding HxlR family transcriptional regulator